MAETIEMQLMFLGQAEGAVNFYTSLFDNSGIEFLERYGPEFPQGPEGQVVHCRFTLNGQHFRAMDSAVPQPFTFTPAIAPMVTCSDAAEVDRLAAALGEGGSFLMPLDSYPFASRYAWVVDRFGVSWVLMFR